MGATHWDCATLISLAGPSGYRAIACPVLLADLMVEARSLGTGAFLQVALSLVHASSEERKYVLEWWLVPWLFERVPARADPIALAASGEEFSLILKIPPYHQDRDGSGMAMGHQGHHGVLGLITLLAKACILILIMQNRLGHITTI